MCCYIELGDKCAVRKCKGEVSAVPVALSHSGAPAEVHCSVASDCKQARHTCPRDIPTWERSDGRLIVMLAQYLPEGTEEYHEISQQG